jgi:sulfide:quinone oxidoreductase
MAGKSIVILGGGIGGIVAAHELRRRLGREHHIVLLDREADHRFQASYPDDGLASAVPSVARGR